MVNEQNAIPAHIVILDAFIIRADLWIFSAIEVVAWRKIPEPHPSYNIEWVIF